MKYESHLAPIPDGTPVARIGSQQSVGLAGAFVAAGLDADIALDLERECMARTRKKIEVRGRSDDAGIRVRYVSDPEYRKTVNQGALLDSMAEMGFPEAQLAKIARSLGLPYGGVIEKRPLTAQTVGPDGPVTFEFLKHDKETGEVVLRSSKDGKVHATHET